MKPQAIKHFKAIFFAFILAIIFFEVSLRFFSPQKISSIPSTLESKYGVPLNRANLTTEILSPIKTSSNHIRSNHETPYEKKSNTFRILALGDSVVLGLGVKEEELWTFHLEKLLNNLNLGIHFEVLNAAAVGQVKPTRHFLYLKNEGYKFSPDLVILGRTQFELNSGIGQEIKIANIRKKETDDNKLKIYPEGIQISPHRNYRLTWLMGQINKLPFYGWTFGKSHLYTWFRSYMNSYLEETASQEADFKNQIFKYLDQIDWEKYKEITLFVGSQEFQILNTNSNYTLPYLSPGNLFYRKNNIENAAHFAMGYVALNEVTNLVSEWGGKTLLMEIPVFADVMGFTKNANYLPRFKKQESVYSFSLENDFIRFQKTYPTPLHIYDDNHWAPGGHYLAAQIIYNHLVLNRLIPVKEIPSSLIKIGDPKNLKIFNKINESFLKNSKPKNYLDLLNAIVHKNSGHSKLAIDSYLKFLKENNEEFEIHLQLAKAYNSIRNIDEVFKHMEIASKGKSKTRSNKTYKRIYAAFKMQLELITHIKNKKFKEAIDLFENYKFPINKNKHKFFYWIGLSNLELNNLLEAENYLIKAIKDKPDNSLYHLILGDIYYQRKKYEKAIISLNNSLSLNKNQKKAYSLSALTQLELGNKNLALSAFKNVLKIDPNNVLALNQIKILSK